jgi:hypothetical protein
MDSASDSFGLTRVRGDRSISGELSTWLELRLYGRRKAQGLVGSLMLCNGRPG